MRENKNLVQEVALKPIEYEWKIKRDAEEKKRQEEAEKQRLEQERLRIAQERRRAE